MPKLLKTLTLVAFVGFVFGCGGSGGGSTDPGGIITDAKITITWPVRSRDNLPAPNSAQSAQVTIENGAVGGGNIVVFITRDDNVSLHYGEYPIGEPMTHAPSRFSSIFYSEPNQGGTIVGQAMGKVEFSGNQARFTHISLVKTVKSVKVLSPFNFAVSTSPTQLLFQADAGNNTVVPVSPGSAQWQLVSGTGSTLTPDGVFTPSVPGYYKVKVTVDEIASPVVDIVVGSQTDSVTFEDLTDTQSYAAAGNAAGGNGILAGKFFLPTANLNPRAAFWTDGQRSDVHPQGKHSSEVLGIHGTSGVGWFSTNGSDSRAAIFAGGGVVELDTGYSIAAATDGNTQVGNKGRKACMWQGTKESFQDLHPSDWRESYATGVSGGDISGWLSNVPLGSTKAVVWMGASHTLTDLDPPGFWGSKAHAISGGTVGGQFTVDSMGRRHACIWHGTPESLIDLNPSFAGGSSVNGVLGDIAVGFYVDPIQVTYTRACIWNGSASKFIDLYAVLGPDYASGSTALSVAAEPGGYQVVGFANRKTGSSGNRIIVWHVPASLLN